MFNKEYFAFAKDEVNAFDILIPPFMERLRILDEKYKDKNAFSFFKKILYISINSNVDSFDLEMFKSINDAFLNSYILELQELKTIYQCFEVGKECLNGSCIFTKEYI